MPQWNHYFPFLCFLSCDLVFFLFLIKWHCDCGTRRPDETPVGETIKCEIRLTVLNLKRQPELYWTEVTAQTGAALQLRRRSGHQTQIIIVVVVLCVPTRPATLWDKQEAIYATPSSPESFLLHLWRLSLLFYGYDFRIKLIFGKWA